MLTMKAGSNPVRQTRPWPFRSPANIDVSEHGVGVPGRQEVEFKDGKRIWLRRVIVDGSPHLFLRELGNPVDGTRIDLRKLLEHVEKELPTTSTRDVAGYVAISLRLKFATLEDFLAAAAPDVRLALGAAWPEGSDG
jgi:hypothetical protein